MSEIDLDVKYFDKKNLMKEYENKFGKTLKNYTLLTPIYLIYNLEKGDVIRYSKNINDKLSCASIIIDIMYEGNYTKIINNDKIENVIDKSKSYIKSMTLQSVFYKKSYWKICPDNYIIFKYIKKTKKRTKKTNINMGIANETLKKLAEVDPTIKNKIIKNNKKKTREYIELTGDEHKCTKDISDAEEYINELIHTNNNKKCVKIYTVENASEYIDKYM